MSDFQPDGDPRRVNRKTALAGTLLVLVVGVAVWWAWHSHWHGATAEQMNKPPATAAAPPSRP